jgi:hypothetical protein
MEPPKKLRALCDSTLSWQPEDLLSPTIPELPLEIIVEILKLRTKVMKLEYEERTMLYHIERSRTYKEKHKKKFDGVLWTFRVNTQHLRASISEKCSYPYFEIFFHKSDKSKVTIHYQPSEIAISLMKYNCRRLRDVRFWWSVD